MIDYSKITRVEFINHAKNRYEIGRVITLYKDRGDFEVIDIEIQDDNKTMKVFVYSKPNPDEPKS